MSAEVETKVTSLELFFDLVFVFAVTQVTSALAADTSTLGAVRGLMVLAAVWWAWVAYAWLTNSASADRVEVRASLLAAMAAMLVVSLSVPDAFGSAALTFAVALAAVRALHLVLFAITARTAEVRRAVKLLAPGVLLGGALLVVAAFLQGAAQISVWAVALAFDYGAPLLGGARGWHVSPAHFAERHGLIVIIALGEAIVSIGVGAAGLAIGVGIVAGAAAGLTCAFCLWWLYFDRAMAFAEHKLTELRGDARNRLARDSYSYLHLPIVAGVVLFALGAKKTLAHVADPLHGVPAVALGVGPALVLLTLSVLRRRHMGRHNRLRLVGAGACLATIPIALGTNALAGLGAVAAILVTLILAEELWARRMAEAGARAQAAPEQALP